MCSHQEWETLAHRIREAVDEERLPKIVADAAARIESVMEELESLACAPRDADWVREHGRRSRTDWIA